MTGNSNSETDGSSDQLDWIRREEFTYYLTIAFMVTDPDDWLAFRRAVYGGLQAALGLTPPPPTGPFPDPRARPDPEPQRQALALLDEIRDHYDPAVNWLGFAFALWDRRHELTSRRRGYTGSDADRGLVFDDGMRRTACSRKTCLRHQDRRRVTRCADRRCWPRRA